MIPRRLDSPSNVQFWELIDQAADRTERLVARVNVGTLKFHYTGDMELAEREYAGFRRCLPQLIDSNEITGDLENKWVIFKDGWVYGMAAYDTMEAAVKFGKQLFRDEPDETYIVVHVSLEDHKVSPLQLLGDALGELEDPTLEV